MRRRGGPVQQWVDSIPSYDSTTSTSSSSVQFTESKSIELESINNENCSAIDSNSDLEKKNRNKDNGDSILKKENYKLVKKSKTMNATAPISIPNSPAITMTCPPSSVPHNRLVRDPSFQSDSSHCSSVESLLEWRKADPEAILLGLGFGYPNSPQENGSSTARIPRRFLQPSKLKGIAVDEFLKQQQESSESLDSASLGYRGLTGSPYVAPSEIVQKIMERLREHESHEIDSYTNTNSSSDLFSSIQQDGRLSVLSPDNRQYLERPRSKSPDMRNKRMIIGQKSFAFAYNGDLIEVDSLNTEERSIENYEYDSNDRITELNPEVNTSTPILNSEENGNLKSVKTRRLAKQLSFDEDLDNSSYDSRDTLYNLDEEENPILVDERLNEEQRDSLITVVARWSESVETAANNFESISQEGIEDSEPNSMSRRASEGIWDSKLNRKSLEPIEERRMSEGGGENEIEIVREGGRDRKPGLRRQARVNCSEDIRVQSGEDLAPYFDKIQNDIPEDELVCGGEDQELDSNILGECSDLGNSETLESENHSGGNGEPKTDEKLLLSLSDESDKCCKNDKNNKLDEISCEHEETSSDCCCHASNSKCLKKMTKIMKKNEKLKQEMAQLREMLNSVMSVRTEPGF